MSNKHILIGGYDFEQKIHRGITFYGKALIKSLSNHTLYLLTSAEEEREKVLKELNILRHLYNPESTSGTPQKPFKLHKVFAFFKRIKFYFKHRIFNNHHSIIKLEHIISELQDYRLNYLKYIKYFYNIPHIYNTTYLHNRLLTTKPYPLNIDARQIDYIFITSPMNIKSKVPIVQTLHDVIPLKNIYHPPSDDSRIFYYRVLNMLKHSEKVIAVSKYSKEECLKIFPKFEEKIEVTYQPIPVYEDEKKLSENPIVQESILKKYNLERDNYLFYVGMLEKRKNIRGMIEAFLSIYEKLKIPLVLAGALGYGSEEFITYLKSKKFRKKIIYMDYINNLDKLVLMKNSRAFLFPSYEEGFGLPPLEAMLMGSVVLTSNTSALPEVCGDAALYVNPFSLDELANGILEITLNESLREKLRLNSKKQVKKFSVREFKTKVESILNSIS